MTQDCPILHIYQQPTHHADAFIFGNRLGLEALRDAIDRALAASADDEPPRMSQNDGECYDCYVRLAAPGWMRLAPTIYTDFNGDWTEAEVNAFDAIRDGRARPPAI